jgi:hypothetical protein
MRIGQDGQVESLFLPHSYSLPTWEHYPVSLLNNTSLLMILYVQIYSEDVRSRTSLSTTILSSKACDQRQ